MTRAAEIEVTPLEEIDLEAAPPCSMATQWHLAGLSRLLGRGQRRHCGRPATHRVRVTCPVHGTMLKFLCARHLRILKLGWAGCWTCDMRSPVWFTGPA